MEYIKADCKIIGFGYECSVRQFSALPRIGDSVIAHKLVDNGLVECKLEICDVAHNEYAGKPFIVVTLRAYGYYE